MDIGLHQQNLMRNGLDTETIAVTIILNFSHNLGHSYYNIILATKHAGISHKTVLPYINLCSKQQCYYYYCTVNPPAYARPYSFIKISPGSETFSTESTVQNLTL